MNALWAYLWPAFAAGLVAGLIAGLIGFRRGRNTRLALAAGASIAIGLAALWHGPIGGADRFSTLVERDLRGALRYYEMTRINAHLHHDPLTRRINLSGRADDFQRSELARLLGQIPGVSSATWSSEGGVPLIAEGAAASILGYLFGLLLAYLIELRRRHNAQWNW
jgi:hypothetical protein